MTSRRNQRLKSSSNISPEIVSEKSVTSRPVTRSSDEFFHPWSVGLVPADGAAAGAAASGLTSFETGRDVAGAGRRGGSVGSSPGGSMATSGSKAVTDGR